MSRTIQRASMLCGAASVWLLHACAHATQAPKPGAAQIVAANASAHEASVEPAGNAKSTQPAVGANACQLSATTLAGLMNDHFLITMWARDRVIEGNVDALRKPLVALASFHYPPEVPASWTESLTRLQDAARATSEAGTLDNAAHGVAAMARVCGDCHLKTSGRAELQLARYADTQKPSDSLIERMQRHKWALDRMWIGLTGPSDAAWDDGAAALQHAPPKMKSDHPVLRGDPRPELATLRALGARAIEAKSSADRAEIYGRALATCAYCHAFGAETE
jgi:hypothetical protein